LRIGILLHAPGEFTIASDLSVHARTGGFELHPFPLADRLASSIRSSLEKEDRLCGIADLFRKLVLR
jgi:hypothetical protein